MEEKKNVLQVTDVHSSLLVDEDEEKLFDKEKVEIAQPNHSTRKYKSALKSLIPFRPFPNPKAHPNDEAGFLSILTFSWLSPLVWQTFKSPPSSNDLWKISEYDETRRNYKRLARLWKQEVENEGTKNASLNRVVWKFVRTRVFLSTICFFLFGVAIFLTSGIVIRQLLQYVSSDTDDLHRGFILVACLCCAEIFRALTLTSFFILNYRTAVRTRAAVLLLVFKKVMKTYSMDKKTSVGELLTMCSNDGDRLFEACRAANAIILGPLLFVTGTVYTCYLLGAISLLGSLVFIVIILLQGVVVKAMNKLRMKAILSSEERIKKLNEIFSSIKMIKMYAWEDYFTKLIDSIREKELLALRKAAILQSINVSFAFLTPVFASVLMISAYVLSNHLLTPELAFTAITIYNAIANALKFMPIAVKSLADANISLKRFKTLISADDIPCYITNKVEEKQNAIEVKNAAFFWSHSSSVNGVEKTVETKSNECDQKAELLNKTLIVNAEQPVLENVNFTAQKGNLIGIFGAVGSGKSSFISGLLGRLHLESGRVAVTGSVAYCAQQAWLMNATVRSNILFGCGYDKERYQDIISSCELLKDFEILQSGDLTEVGERGINLSGGQKQRISLARALYCNKDIYLLDDPMSALDAHVGKSIFSEVVLKRLKNCGKTVVLVTHQTQYLSFCDVSYQIKNGTITEVTDLDEAENFNEVNDHEMKSAEENDIFDVDLDENVSSATEVVSLAKATSVAELDLELQGKLLTTEEVGKGIPAKTYKMFFKASGGYIATLFMGLFFLINVGAQQFSNYWLSYWLKQGSGNVTRITNTNDAGEILPVIFYDSPSTNFSTDQPDLTDQSTDILLNPKLNFYLTIYGLSALFMFVVSIVRGYAFVSMTIRASRVLHKSLFDSVMHGTMAFFDTTPTGRILNRFQKDADEQDVLLPFLLEMFLFNIASFLFAFGLVAYVFPKFLIIIAVIFPVCLIIYVVFKPTAREMRRLDSLTRSPWFAHIGTTVTGLDTIRAYKRSKDFIQQFCDLLDKNGVPCYLFACVNRWLAVRLDFLTIIVSVVLSMLVVVYKDLVSPAFAGLALSSAFYMNGMLQFTVRMLIECEARFVCTDRIRYYIDYTPHERDSAESATPKKDWPHAGRIEFQNACMRYRDGLPLVLKDLTFTVNPGEKIGIVGRTGSGKSSLSVALFRLTDLASGRILIDDIDIATVPLHHLRSQISIIPQDPVLFSGTIRYNLDPFNQYSDADMWTALEHAHLKENVSKLAGQLDEAVLENGSNFSVGERQLMCLARALLRNSKVLVLDEATAAVDMETEKIVHEVIDDRFAHCTVATIAHRLSTVVKSDRILVLDDGKVVEFDVPQKLLEDESSAFHNMLKTFNTRMPDHQ